MPDPPGSHTDLDRLLAGATPEGAQVGVVGSGSNLLVADGGVRGLILRLDGELTTIEGQGRRIPCGGCATTAEWSRR
jgi:UDP-N-acetylmuramate dehydrogenase